MTAHLHIANIVILANTHNPSILSEEWLDRHNVIRSGELVLRTPQVSIVKSNFIEMVADLNRVQFAALEFDSKCISACASAAKNYLLALPHIPYTAFGFNFHYLTGIPPGENDLEIDFNGQNISELLDKKILMRGFITLWDEKRGRCRLTLDPAGPKGSEFVFNLHFEPLTDVSDHARTLEKEFKEFHELSSGITKSFLKNGGD